eukprot:TRINITY_DN9972_c0_g4_i4.p1 TRINITY_DN9972_c0_g4~~TRINITY_DN9972_c0_g4_i4.p1  ORF type:complete len:633 (-),score=131.31 TRINITY_DN9972_c0_g4_i4:278-2176(-)
MAHAPTPTTTPPMAIPISIPIAIPTANSASASISETAEIGGGLSTTPIPTSPFSLHSAALGSTASSSAAQTLARRFLCGICAAPCEEPRLLPCFHLFCRACLQIHRQTRGLSDHTLCPVCMAHTPAGLSSQQPSASLVLATELVRQGHLHMVEPVASGSAHGLSPLATSPTSSTIIGGQSSELDAASQHLQLGAVNSSLEKTKASIAASLHRAHARESILSRAAEIILQSEQLLAERCFQTESDIHAMFDRLFQALHNRKEHLLAEIQEKKAVKEKSLQKQQNQIQQMIKEMKCHISTAEVIQRYASDSDVIRIRSDLCQILDSAGRSPVPLEPVEKLDLSLLVSEEVQNEANIEDLFTKFGQLRWDYADISRMKVALKRRGSMTLLHQYEINQVSKMTTKIGSKGSGFGRLNHPYRIAVDFNTGFLIVSDSDNNRVQIFQSDGTPIRMFGSEGSGEENFLFPRGVAVDDESRIAVTDQWNHRVHIINIDGSFICTFGSKGKGPGQFNEPYGVAFDQRGQLLVADADNHRIQVLSIEGSFIRMFGKKGTGNGEFKHPSGITVDDSDRIIVSDTLNHRVQIFNAEGEFVRCIGKKGSKPGEFMFPEGVDTDSKGNIFVADAGNNRIQVSFVEF